MKQSPASHRIEGDGYDRPWIDVTTMGDLLDRRAQLTPEGEALVLPDDRVTFAGLARRASFYARALIGLDVEPGDTVGILMPNTVDFVAAMFGAIKAGAIPVLMNARFKARELRHVIGNGDITIILTSTTVSDAVDFPELLEQAIPVRDDVSLLRHFVLVDDDARPGFLGAADLANAATGIDAQTVDDRQVKARVGDVAMIIYTSGTTASPKGAMLTHEGLVRQAMVVAQTRFFLDPDDAVWSPLPFFHIGGMGWVITCIAAGCPIVHAGHFDPAVALRQLVDERCTVALPAFETIWLAVLDHPDFAAADLRRLRLVVNVGVPERLAMMQERLPHAPTVSTFGGTEATSHLSMGVPDDPLETRLTTGGFPLPGIDVRIIDVETGEEAARNEPGEIQYRGWSRFAGYYNEPEITAAVIDEAGWFHSADIGTMDTDGRVTFVGRLKDMLKVGGENVAAAEVEGFLIGHPAVRLVQVVAAPDAKYTEVVAAFIELEPDAAATEAEIIEFCRGEIATFKIPRYVRFVTEWPMSSTKIKKYVLRDQLSAELAAAGVNEAPRITSG